MFERFDRDAREVVVAAVTEAGARGDRRIGTDHLLLGLFHVESLTQAFGVTLADARDAARTLDLESLRAVGLDISDSTPVWAPAAALRRAPFSTGAKHILSQALKKATAQGSRTIQSRHLALAILDFERPDPAAALLAALGIDTAGTLARLSSREAA